MTALRRWLNEHWWLVPSPLLTFACVGVLVEVFDVHSRWLGVWCGSVCATATCLCRAADTSGAWGRFLCWTHLHAWGDYGDITGREHCSRCGLLRWPKLSDITPGWQERAEKFRETVRTCAHPYHERARSNRKGWFCMWCGRMLNEDGSER